MTFATRNVMVYENKRLFLGRPGRSTVKYCRRTSVSCALTTVLSCQIMRVAIRLDRHTTLGSEMGCRLRLVHSSNFSKLCHKATSQVLSELAELSISTVKRTWKQSHLFKHEKRRRLTHRLPVWANCRSMAQWRMASERSVHSCSQDQGSRVVSSI
jgi:hypothetical protein